MIKYYSYVIGAVKRPKATLEGKFSGMGIVQPEALMDRVGDQKTAEALARKANYGLTANTQESYKKGGC